MSRRGRDVARSAVVGQTLTVQKMFPVVVLVVLCVIGYGVVVVFAITEGDQASSRIWNLVVAVPVALAATAAIALFGRWRRARRIRRSEDQHG